MISVLRSHRNWGRLKNPPKIVRAAHFLGMSQSEMLHQKCSLRKVSRLGCVSNASRDFCRVNDSRCTELYMEELFEAGVGEEDPLGDLRNILYPEKLEGLTEEQKTTDPLFRLSYASSMDEVMQVLDLVDDASMNITLTSQALSTLFQIQKFGAFMIDYEDEADAIEARAEFNRILNEEPKFIKLVQMIRQDIPQMSFQVASYLFMCLRRMEQPLSSPVMQDFIIHLRRNFSSLDATCLSYFCVGIRGRNLHKSKLKEATLMWYGALAPALPRVRELVRSMETHDEAKKIAIVLNITSWIVNDSLLTEFMDKVEKLVRAGQFDSDESLSSLVKILALKISFKDWFLDKTIILRPLLYALRNRTHKLRPLQANIVSKVIRDTWEPVAIFNEIHETIQNLYQRWQSTPHTEERNQSLRCVEFLPKMDFLEAIMFSQVTHFSDKDLQPIILDAINSPGFKFSLSQIYNILRVMNFDDSIVEAFFNRTFEVCKDDLSDLTQFAMKCLNFKYRERGNKKHEFEKKMAEVFLRDSLTTPFPGRFAIEFSFLLGYDHEIPQEVFKRFESMLGQFNTFAVRCISQGLQIRHQSQTQLHKRSFKHDVSFDTTTNVLHRVEVCLEERLRQLIQTDGDDFAALYQIIPAYLRRRKFLLQESFSPIVENLLIEKLRGRHISLGFVRHITYALKNASPSICMPSIVDFFIDYALEHRSHFHSLSFIPLLLHCFRTNHDIKNKAFLEVCSACLMRDFKPVHSSYIIRSAIALIKYQALKPCLVAQIFSSDFMERLDKEIESNKFGYAKSLRRDLMELNRTVCLHYPEYKIPWFHEKYCQEEAASSLRYSAHFSATFNEEKEQFFQLRDDVYSSLCRLVDGPRYLRENVFSPYYNFIDFEVWQDESGSFAPLGDFSSNLVALRQSKDLSSKSQGVETSWHKYAVTVSVEGDYTQDTKNSVGSKDLNEKNLELQGYSVISINPFVWNSLQMNIPDAKLEYLRSRFRPAQGKFSSKVLSNGGVQK